MHVSNGNAFKFIGEHNTDQGASTVAPTTQIIMEAMFDLNQNTAALMPRERTLKQMVQRTRRQVHNILAEPSNL